MGLLAASGLDTGTAIGAGALILGIFGYLIKELRRKDDGVWAIVASKDAEIHRLETERDFWRNRQLADDDAHREDRP